VFFITISYGNYGVTITTSCDGHGKTITTLKVMSVGSGRACGIMM
jgi:hypothetical protein